MKQKIEILAPAGSYESFQAAVHAGSDAVYLGGTMFSARASADNFNKEQLLTALDYAHLHGRKVYMTVNTLLKEPELSELPEYLLPFYERGLDAVIVQDVGVLKTVSEVFPQLPVHLSTQMTLTGGLGAELLEQQMSDYHVTRLVPARELSFEEIKKLRQETTLELEVFVHGALCVCYSGQCFLSSMIGGRSGNRGRCAQPCRKLYLPQGTGKQSYLLSPKDLCTIEMIPDLIEAGIDSFKIEGRMKKPEYTAYISWLYRKYADRYLQYGRKEYEAYLKNHPQELQDDLRGMKDLYNRGGFTKGYFISHNGRDMMSMKRPNHEGVPVGKVEAVRGNKAHIIWQQQINPQDILEIREHGKKIYEYTSGTAQSPGSRSQAGFFAGTAVTPGMEVFRTRNNQLLSWIQEHLIGHPLKIKVNGAFYASPDKEALLTVWRETEDGESCSVTVKGVLCQQAQKQPMTEEAVRKQLSKLGDTEFAWETLDIVLEGDSFLPVKSLNELRRQALEEFSAQYLEKFYRQNEECYADFAKSAGSETEAGREAGNNPAAEELMQKRTAALQRCPQLAAEVLTAEQWCAALKASSVHIIYARMEILEKKELLSLAGETISLGKECFLSLPRILRKEKRQMTGELMSLLISAGLCRGILVHNLEELGFVKKFLAAEESGCFHKIRLAADFSMYSTNSQAIRFWKEQGCGRVTASIEQGSRELSELFMKDYDVETEIQVYGKLPLMVSAQCITNYANGKECTKIPGQTMIVDEWKEAYLGMNFCSFCYNILYSAKPCDFRGYTEELLKTPYDVWRCSFVNETMEETAGVLASVRKILDGNLQYGADHVWGGRFHRSSFSYEVRN